MAQSIALAPKSRCGEGLIRWVEPITAFPGNAKPCLKKQKKNKQGSVFGRAKPRLWSDSQEIAGDYPIQVSE
jgi:hypothetical protein